ncbi:hypothetical protein ACHHYP_09819 [Achlya hypogyna]|uniref:Condensation domain-containing protein n=1 Tax=Achlya hypogyna TaxID=1202772 RepID=A0A1V9YMB4_ACHHY|nr:hypothetical protein ACHHYP_09819 [Achlya hypogyna]
MERTLNTTEAMLKRSHTMGIDTPLIGQVELAVAAPFAVDAFVAALQRSVTRLVYSTPALQEILSTDGQAIVGATDAQLDAVAVVRIDMPDVLAHLLTIKFDLFTQVAIRVVVTVVESTTVVVSLVMGHVFTDGDSLFTVLHAILADAGIHDTGAPIVRVPWTARPQAYDIPSDVSTVHEVVGFIVFLFVLMKRKLFGMWKPLIAPPVAIAAALATTPEAFPHYTHVADVPAATLASLRAGCKARGITLTTLLTTAAMAAAASTFKASRVAAQTMINMRWHGVHGAGLGGYATDSDTAMCITTEPSTLSYPAAVWAQAIATQWFVEPAAIQRAIGRCFFVRHLNIRDLPAADMYTGECLTASIITSNLGAPRHFTASYFHDTMALRKSRFCYGTFVPFFGFSTYHDVHVTLTCRTSMLPQADAARWMATFMSLLQDLAEADSLNDFTALAHKSI